MSTYLITRYSTTTTDGRQLLKARLLPPPLDTKQSLLARLFTPSIFYTFLAYVPKDFKVGTIVEIPDSFICITNADYQLEVVKAESGKYLVQRKR